MNKRALVALVLAGLFLLSGRSGAATVLGLPDSGKEIQVKTGEDIELSLEEQGGTGYTWEFHHFDEKHFQLKGTETRHPSGQLLMGGPVLRVWHLKAKVPGEARLRLDYLRPWEGRASAVKYFEVKVIITE